MSSAGVDYADYEEIHSVAAAVIFAVLYTPLFVFNIFQAINSRNRIYFILTFVSVLRIVAFSLRAALAGSDSAAHNESLFIAEQVFYNIGFFAIVESAYTICLDRQILANTERVIQSYLPPVALIPLRLMQNRRLIHLVLIAAVVCSVVAIIEISTGTTASDISTGTTLRHVSIIIYLAVGCALALQTILLALSESSSDGDSGVIPMHETGPGSPQSMPPKTYAQSSTQFGALHGSSLLGVVAILIIAREAFFEATYNNLAKQNQESLWYPLAALTEFLAIIVFTIPGLIPPYDDRIRSGSTGGSIIGLLASRFR